MCIYKVSSKVNFGVFNGKLTTSIVLKTSLLFSFGQIIVKTRFMDLLCTLDSAKQGSSGQP